MSKSEKGFTLIEILLVLGIILAVGFVVVVISVSKVQSSQTESLLTDTASIMFLYQQNAYSGKNGKSYGIHFESDSYSLFIGDSYAAAESSDTVALPGDTTISTISLTGGGNDIVFASGSFKPSTDGFVRFSNGMGTYVLQINAQGLIDWYAE